MAENPFDAPSGAALDEDIEFDRQIAKSWMGRTWGMMGGAIGLTVLQCFCNPFGILSLVAIAASFATVVRAFSVPAPVKPHLNNINLVPGIVGIVLLLPAILSILATFGQFALR